MNRHPGNFREIPFGRYFPAIGMTILGWILIPVYAADPAPAKSDAEIDKLIAMLKSEDFEARERATQSLSECAPEAWERLRLVAQGDDLEAQKRARQILEKVLVPILPITLGQQVQKLRYVIEVRYGSVQKVFQRSDEALKKQKATGQSERIIAEPESKLKAMLAIKNREELYYKQKCRELSDLAKRIPDSESAKVFFQPEDVGIYLIPWLLPFEKRLLLPVLGIFDSMEMREILDIWRNETGVAIERVLSARVYEIAMLEAVGSWRKKTLGGTPHARTHAPKSTRTNRPAG